MWISIRNIHTHIHTHTPLYILDEENVHLYTIPEIYVHTPAGSQVVPIGTFQPLLQKEKPKWTDCPEKAIKQFIT
jgi:hypothetical protein